MMVTAADIAQTQQELKNSKSCSVCGREHSRNSKIAKHNDYHKLAAEQNWLEKKKKLDDLKQLYSAEGLTFPAAKQKELQDLISFLAEAQKAHDQTQVQLKQGMHISKCHEAKAVKAENEALKAENEGLTRELDTTARQLGAMACMLGMALQSENGEISVIEWANKILKQLEKAHPGRVIEIN
jgi:hypothetical protein